ncbi:hypothetical protein [Entomobacter blattae]|uniref:hypothetical protein n=1 Tax=Entomobacter blattae TaxID=2762277 RepID=UPI00193BA893|nr:hypothetical protein [Entomobacter blattae]
MTEIISELQDEEGEQMETAKPVLAFALGRSYQSDLWSTVKTVSCQNLSCYQPHQSLSHSKTRP